MSMIRRESFGSADDEVVLETHDALYRLLLEPDAPALSSSVESSVRASPSEDPRSYRRERSRSRSLAERISRARLSRAPTVRDLRRMHEDSERSKGEHEELRDGDGDVFQSLDCSDELTSMRLRAMRWAVAERLPFKFEFMSEQNCSRSLSQAIVDVDAFYIGATVDPVRRWQGCSCTDRGDKAMSGHRRDGWSWMLLLALTTDARELEKRLIVEGKRKWPDLCANIASDSRGQCQGANWIYVCVK
jgi:hypothetical protein